MTTASCETHLIDHEMIALLRDSGYFDADFYRNKNNLQIDVDLVTHHLTVGWQQGFEPNSFFEGLFLQPFYSAAGFVQAPILTWLELRTIGGFTPSCKAEAEALAKAVRENVLFDQVDYARRLPTGMDPALHYVVIGERIGWQPYPGFDALYYADRYPDLLGVHTSLLEHYATYGQHERRSPLAAVDRLVFTPLIDDGRPVVLMISHEASRTGAPLLGWNIARRLAKKCNVISLMLRGGELEADFAAVAAVTVGPLTWDDWQPLEMRRVAERIVAKYRPLYAISNSIETCLMVPPLAVLGVPSVALIHEFAAYTRPLQKMRHVYDWAAHVIFPAKIVADSSMRAFPDLKARTGLHLLAQGGSDLPTRGGQSSGDARATKSQSLLRPAGYEDAFVVLGAGTVQLRKGVDLFISAAATALRLRPDIKFRFVWIGHGYDPINENAYSTYIAEQILHSNLGNSFAIVQALEDLDPIYAETDVFFMSSRLDPQPNVGIDAITRGIPTVCFQDACGTAEILGAHPDTRSLVVPHLDVYAAAEKICQLADQRDNSVPFRAAIAAVGHSAYDMEAYVARIDALGQASASALQQDDLNVLIASGAVDPSLLIEPGSDIPIPMELERTALLTWSLWNGMNNAPIDRQLRRRACPGFHPQRYAQDHMVDCMTRQRDPLAHWLDKGRPSGPWSREVFFPSDAQHLTSKAASRIALHVHFYYSDLATSFVDRLNRNNSQVDLFLSTNDESQAKELRHIFRHHRGQVTTFVSPNTGRDIGPFLTGLADEISDGGYDIFGHVHAKRSLAVDAKMGDSWRNFLWENLIGGRHAMLDLAAAVFATKPSIGLLIAEDPHLVGWGENRLLAENLATRMGLQVPLDEFFDFPLGTMFWARPEALRPLLRLGLSWDSYPKEPLPYDGTILHALERLVPFAAQQAGFDVAGLRVPNTTW